jgi:hypothetical protein
VNPTAPLRVVSLATSPAPVPPPVAVLRRTFDSAPDARSTPPPAPGVGPNRAAPALPSLPPALRDVEAVRARLDGMLDQARRGRTFSPQELLCLQADAHRFAQTVEFTSRAVEHGVQGLRQALNAQV